MISKVVKSHLFFEITMIKKLFHGANINPVDVPFIVWTLKFLNILKFNLLICKKFDLNTR